MNIVEILGIAALVLGMLVFVSGCLWSVYTLEKMHKKPKTKKA